MNTDKLINLIDQTLVVSSVFDVANKHNDLNSMQKLVSRQAEISKEMSKEVPDYAKSK